MLYRARPTNEGHVIESADAPAHDALVVGVMWSPLSTISLDALHRDVNAAARDAAGPGARLVARGGAWETWSDVPAGVQS